MTDLIDQIWRSTANQELPPASRDAVLAVAQAFARRDARRRRHLILTGLVLGLFSLGVAMALFDRGRQGAAVAALVLLALSWMMWVLLLAQGRPDVTAQGGAAPISQTLHAMLRRNRRERRSALVMAGVILFSIAPTWLAVGQLQVGGQASPREAQQMAAVLTLALLAGAGFLLLRLFSRLSPERLRLDRLIADHEHR